MTVCAAVLVALAMLLATSGERSRLRRLLPPRENTPTPIVDVADAADLLALVLRSGRGVTAAMSVVAGHLTDHLDGRLGTDLEVVVAARAWGLSDEQAWLLVDAAWQPVARALVLAEAAGVPPATTLAAAAEDIRRAEGHRLEIATERLGVRLVLPLGLTFLPAFVSTTVLPVVGALAGDVLGG